MSAVDRTYRTATAIDDGGILRSALACHVCKRRKSKCDRTLPACAACIKSGQLCEYPTSAQKPGPKTGMCHRSKKRKPSESTAVDDQSPSSHGITRHSSDTSNHFVSGASDLLGSYRQQIGSTQSSLPGHHSYINSSKNLAGLPSPVPTVATARSSISSESKSNTLSQIIHPSHEPTLKVPKSWNQSEFTAVQDKSSTTRRIIEGVCKSLHISADLYYYLLTAYFDNMTAFSLFHRPRFETKLREVASPVQVQALLAAMFSFSARFRDRGSAGPLVDLPSPEYFHNIALRLINEALEACSEETPPLCLLQAMILSTFQQLIAGVRGKAWRSLGNCIRIAYELQLHLIDSKRNNEIDSISEQEVEKWVFEEEQRRTWWVLWEFDVFASTIRRLPTAIDWHQNETWLPVDDKYWFGDVISLSSCLATDPQQRWRLLEKTGNKSGKAWFIVFNSLMRNAQSVATLQSMSSSSSSRARTPSAMATKDDTAPTSRSAKDAEIEMNTISDALCCATMALPEHLTHRGEFLSFRPSLYPSITSTRQSDATKYSIHIMKQLTRFMIYHQQVFHGSWRDIGQVDQVPSSSRGVSKPNQGAWTRYLDAADGILTIIRNSSSDHVQYVNPFLANTIWLAAASQVACKIFGPPVANTQAVQSNLDLLRLTFNSFVSFWNSSSTLQEKLNTLESRLESFRSSEMGKCIDTVQATQNGSNQTGSHRSSAAPRQQDVDVGQSIDIPRAENTEHITQAPTSNYFQAEAMPSPSVPIPMSYIADPSSSIPVDSLDFGGFFPEGGFESWDEWGLEELLTYGYD